MRRGDVIRVDLENPPGGAGHEQTGQRPAIVISLADDDPNNPMMTVIPSTTSEPQKKRFPHILEVNPSAQNGLTAISILLAFQIQSLDKRRVVEVIGTLEPEYMNQLEQKLRELIGL